MKKILTRTLIIGSLFLCAGCISSLATVGNNGWIVTLYHNSPDVKIQENGRDCRIVEAYAAHKKAGYAAYTSINGSNGTFLYTDGIQLDKSNDSHIITVSRGSKSVDVTLTHKSQPFLDITAALGESKEMSYSELQSEFLKLHKKKK
jgi:hypothetical protein